MHHCFEALHGKLGTADARAAGTDASQNGKQAFLKQQQNYRERLNAQARRLDAFMTLTMAQLEHIRVRYRPSGYFCHVPVVRDVIGIFSDQCMPIKTAVNERG